jgi:hypothetical protein
MTGIEASLEEIRAYGVEAAAMAGDIAHAGSFDLAANMAAMTPVFGVVGAEFLAAFAAAQAEHAESYASLAAYFAGAATAAHGSADAYERVDSATAEALASASLFGRAG